jgi:hypothetical protein
VKATAEEATAAVTAEEILEEEGLAGDGLVLEGMGHVDSGIEGLVVCAAAAEATLADERAMDRVRGE